MKKTLRVAPLMPAVIVLALACGDSSGGSETEPGSTSEASAGVDTSGSTADGPATSSSSGADATSESSATTSGPTTQDPSETSETGAQSPCGDADIICDDFEAGAPGDNADAAWSYTGNPANTPVLTAAKAARGGQSLHFPTADNQGVFVYPGSGLPTGDNVVYVRAYVNFAKPFADMNGHVAFITGATLPENGVEVRLGASKNFGNQQMMLDINFIGDGQEHTQFSNGDYTGGSPGGGDGVQLEPDTWYCVEALFNGAQSEFQVWIDGAEIPELHVTDWGVGRLDWAPMYNVLKLGAHNYSGSLGEVWYDDVAISSQPIGCI